MEPTIESFAAMLRTNLNDPNSTAYATVEDLDRWCALHGYAVVKLPEMVVDQSDTPTWPVPDISRWTEIFIRHSDRRVAMDAVPTPLDRPEHALAVGAALIAAAQYVLAVRDA
ncbi:hypothetical protein [Nocardia otitidiscaviarum]|uniref:hypothetical protein n=1 Tax=Nocardia otitidiscaviarum TaxID=1823 RepID=UPI0024579CAA|nr:hypothetical protein [Nocardia otitidiscaviarum]